MNLDVSAMAQAIAHTSAVCSALEKATSAAAGHITNSEVPGSTSWNDEIVTCLTHMKVAVAQFDTRLRADLDAVAEADRL